MMDVHNAHVTLDVVVIHLKMQVGLNLLALPNHTSHAYSKVNSWGELDLAPKINYFGDLFMFF